MSKYIIKNCPCRMELHENDCFGHTGYYNCCACTDCVMKQIVDLCKKDKNFCINCKAEADDNIDCIDCTQGGRAELGAEILEFLDIQEVE